MSDDTPPLVSAMPRQFVVTVEPKLLTKHGLPPRVLMISAISPEMAQKNAFRKIRVGKFKHVVFSSLKFTVEEAEVRDESSDG